MSISVKKMPHHVVLRSRFVSNQRKITFSFSIVLIFLAALLFLYVFQNMELLQMVNQKEKLKKKIFAMEKLMDKYKQEEVMLSSLQRVEFIAREQLKMIPPGRRDRIYLPSHGPDKTD